MQKTREKQRALISAALVLSMVLSLFGGGLTGTTAAQTITTDRETAYEPMEQSASVAYEEHEEGYTVTLDRSAESLTANITAVPKSEGDRVPEGARLYIHTGVTLTPGETYQVSFALQADQAQPEYAVRFDGGTEEGAYGTLEGRTIRAGDRDLVIYRISPEKDNGELVLCLLVGSTGEQGNILRFSGLAVEEALENETGENRVLVDQLNYNAPGFIRIWTNDDSKAVITSEEDSATLTVTQAPDKAEVWKIKLLVATGLKPEAGKTYRFRADVKASASRSYEICYNEGDTEKGYDVLYNQQLTTQKQTLDRRIYVPSDKENPGELIVQLSLGNLKTGDKVTISNVRVEEAIPKYTNVLAKDFAYDKTYIVEEYDPNSYVVTGSREIETNIGWQKTDTEVICSGTAYASLFKDGVKVWIAGGKNVWDGKVNINTAKKLEPNKNYRITFNVEAINEYENYEVLFGTSLNEKGDNNSTYGSQKGLTISANTPETVTHIIKADSKTALLLTLQLGATNDKGNEVTISNISIEEVTGTDASINMARVSYPTDGILDYTLDNSDGNISTVSTENGSIKLDVATVSTQPAAYKTKLYLKVNSPVEAGKYYAVSFSINGQKEESNWEINFGKDGDNKEYGAVYGGDLPHIVADKSTKITQIIPGNGGRLWIILCLGYSINTYNITNVDVKEVRIESSNPDSAKAEIESAGDGYSIKYDITAAAEAWSSQLIISTGVVPQRDKEYNVVFKIKGKSELSTENWEVACGKQNDANAGDKIYAEQYAGDLGIITGEPRKIKIPLLRTENMDGTNELVMRLKLGSTVNCYWIENIMVIETGPVESGSLLIGGNGSFRVRSDGDFGGHISASQSEDSVQFTCTGGDAGEGNTWKRGLFIDDLCYLDAGKGYKVSFDISATTDTTYEVFYNKDEDYGAGHEKGFGWLGGKTVTQDPSTIEYEVVVKEGGKLRLRIDLGRAAENTQVTVSNIQVKEIIYSPSPAGISLASKNELTRDMSGKTSSEGLNFSSFEKDVNGYEATLEYNSEFNRITINIERPIKEEPATWKAKLRINTGKLYELGKAYQASFKISSTAGSDNFCVLFLNTNDRELDWRGTWEQTVGAGETKVITTRPLPADSATGPINIDIELGKFNGTSNSYTISDFHLYEVSLKHQLTGARIDGTATNDMQPGYRAPITREKDSATLDILETPEEGMEAWKSKMFLDTGVSAYAGEAYRVTFDVLAAEDMDFEVCYNRLDEEKGFDALYGIHATGGKVKTVEKVFTAETGGRLKVQLSLGTVPAPNRVTVSNLKVERIAYSYSGRSALPAPATYTAPGAVSYWAHEDYATSFVGGDNAVTANITSTPEKNAEAWKIKLFLDTGAVLQPGKYYKVTAALTGKEAQDYEICYNNGGVEMGYDSLGGLHLNAGKPQTVEKIVGVSADKTDATNLMLQINLGKTTRPNSVTVGGVKVEEVSLAYADMMRKDFSCSSGSTVSLWTNTDYTANLDKTASSATVHITGVPATAAEVWKVKMLVSTGAVLEAGKTYQVKADLQGTKGQNYEVCFNNEETEKGFDALYNQTLQANTKTTIVKQISVPASMTDAGELVLQFSVGGAVANDITVSNVSVEELRFGGSGSTNTAPDTVVTLDQNPTTAAGTLDVSREALTYSMTKISSESKDNAITIQGANLRAADPYTVSFTAKADKNLAGTLALVQANGETKVLSENFQLTPETKEYSFTTAEPLAAGGLYDISWQFGSAENRKAGDAQVVISDVSVSCPPETLQIMRSTQKVTINGVEKTPEMYAINGYNYFKLRDLAVIMNDTDAQFVVRYNKKTNSISLTTGKPYTPVGGEMEIGADESATCIRTPQTLSINGRPVNLKAYAIGGNNYFRLRDLNELLGFKIEYVAATNMVAIASPLTPDAQEKANDYDIFFLPEIDGESQGYVGDTMPFYDNGTYYVYYLKDGGDAYNHSVYVTTTQDFVTWNEQETPVLNASREDVQDNWIGTGSVVRADSDYYFFYTGYTTSTTHEYREKIMVAKGTSPTTFTKVAGWEITPPAELGQKTDFRDPQAYYDPATGTFSLTVTASQNGAARILKYTLGKDLQNVTYDGIIYTDPTGDFMNLECSDTFQLGGKWYLTYSGQDDTLWYAMADSRFGPYTNAQRLDGKLFYAGKHVENGTDLYMVGWGRRSDSPSNTGSVTGWAGNLVAQKVSQKADGSLVLVPVDSIVSEFDTPKVLPASEVTVTAASGAGFTFKEVCTSSESFLLKGEFTYTGTGSFGLAFDYNGSQDAYKLISIDPTTNKLGLSFQGGTVPITETQIEVKPNEKHSFTYIQDGSVGIFYLDSQASLVVRLYGVTDKPISLFAENNSVTFTSMQLLTRS